MKWAHKKAKGAQAPVGTVMFVLNLVFVALLATATGQSAFTGIPRYIQGQWIIADEIPQYEDNDGLAVEERIWPESPPEVVGLVTAEDQNSLTTPELYVLKEQGEEQSAVWKIVLVAAILLVSIVGSVSMAYYLCVWRGGRIHYQPQKEGYA